MNNDILEKIKDFVAENLVVKKEKLTAGTRLLEDLGIDGDDAAEFIEVFSKKFDIDMTDFVFEKHFGQEGFNPLMFLYRFLFNRKKLQFTTITLSDLLEVVQQKKWPKKLRSEIENGPE
ncbi:MAG: DUF1493 family protein [candidate division Zixibacteria bacterium]|nr:DUF1493 family protein [candidate division Zixibacteria bacterium]